MYTKREENEIFCNEKKQRNFIKVNGKIMSYSVYVAQHNPEICGKWKDGCEVHHLNNNSLDDRPENLIVLTKEAHHLIHRTPVDVFYVGDEGVVYKGRFPGVREAGAKLNMPATTISYYCKYNRPISSTWSKWRFSYVY